MVKQVIMPLQRNNWAEMMEDVVAASLKVRADESTTLKDFN